MGMTQDIRLDAAEIQLTNLTKIFGDLKAVESDSVGFVGLLSSGNSSFRSRTTAPLPIVFGFQMETHLWRQRLNHVSRQPTTKVAEAFRAFCATKRLIANADEEGAGVGEPAIL